MVSLLFSFKGRISRLTYWGLFFFRFPVYSILASGVYAAEEADWVILLISPILLALLYAEIAIVVKRLHDTSRSGLSLLWSLFPIVGVLYLFVVCGFLRDPKPNRYGDPPESVVIPVIKELLSCIPLIPKALWRFTLNRVRELGKAFRGEN